MECTIQFSFADDRLIKHVLTFSTIGVLFPRCHISRMAIFICICSHRQVVFPSKLESPALFPLVFTGRDVICLCHALYKKDIFFYSVTVRLSVKLIVEGRYIFNRKSLVLCPHLHNYYSDFLKG